MADSQTTSTGKLNTGSTIQRPSAEGLTGDILGGTAAMLVALPSAIAFGLIIFAPLGASFAGKAALAGIMGTIAIGLITPLFGGTKRLISAPCAPAAAVLSVFVTELLAKGAIAPESIPIYVIIVALLAGTVQIIAGYFGGGKFIKYIPYPVVAGYLSGVGVIIFSGQLPKLLGVTGKASFWHAAATPSGWRWESIAVGIVTILVMLAGPKITKKLPASILALIGGICAYFVIALFNPVLLTLEGNPLVIGAIKASPTDLSDFLAGTWGLAASVDLSLIAGIVIPVLTLAVLLSIDTLKTCVVLDALTYSRHNSNKELIGQGLGNIGASLLCGIPGAGTMGATLVNLNSGAKTQKSGMFVGLTAILVLLLFGSFVAWIPLAALAGILIVVAVRMLDKKSLALLKHKTTMLDFAVILAVVISAVSFSLITAAGVGVALAILLFLREQIRTSVIRRKVRGNQKFSKKIRLEDEIDILRSKGSQTIIIELQGQLFFGTTDQLFTELEPYLKDCKYVLLDMQRVLSVDYTAANMLKQILARVKNGGGHLLFTSVPLSLPTGQNVREYLIDLGLTEAENLHFFERLDDGIEWCEDELLKSELPDIHDDSVLLDISQLELFEGFDDRALATLKECMIEKNYQPGELIFSMGEESDEIYFIRKGNVRIVLPLSGGVNHHLVSFSRGGFFGDMSFLDKGVRSANAVAEGEVSLYILSRDKFNDAVQHNPAAGELFFERLAHTIANRLRNSNIELKALQEE